MKKRYPKELSTDQLAAVPDEQIDYRGIPELDDAFFANARLVLPTKTSKKTVTMRLDQDVIDWFRHQGKGHLTRMNAVLRAYMLSQKPDETRRD